VQKAALYFIPHRKNVFVLWNFRLGHRFDDHLARRRSSTMDYAITTALVAAWCIGAPAVLLCFLAGDGTD
jgi:hypothetical protein